MSANIGATICRLHSNRKRNIRKKGKTKSRLFRLREEELYASTAVTLTSMTSSSRFEISSWKKKHWELRNNCEGRDHELRNPQFISREKSNPRQKLQIKGECFDEEQVRTGETIIPASNNWQFVHFLLCEIRLTIFFSKRY